VDTVLAPEELAWKGWIAPETLLEQVRNTAPFLFVNSPETEFFRIIEEAEAWVKNPPEGYEAQLEHYFRLCLAVHQTTVATFIPTDVDSKIRGLVWAKTRDRELLRRMGDQALAMGSWPVAAISRRWDEVDQLGAISGHNGEWLSVLAGAHGRFLEISDAEYAEKTAEAIHAELEREAESFRIASKRQGREIEALRIAASVTHNLGDLDQGISFWEGSAALYAASKVRFHRLAHENKTPYGGIFQVAAKVYSSLLASEGHRHYPLRPVKALRKSADLLLPLGPFLDDWGATVGQHAALAKEDRVEVLDALIKGCVKVPGQQGYFRAIAGFAEAAGRNFEQAVDLLPAGTKKKLRDSAFQKLVTLPRGSFESSMKKAFRKLVG
jgi:hypothetical protein